MNPSRTRKNGKKTVGCPVESTLEAIGGQWKVLVIYHLMTGTRRFGELTRLLGGISARTLARQLRELEASGIVDRFVHPQIPPRVDYSLTALGRKLMPILQAMSDWADEAEKGRKRAKSP